MRKLRFAILLLACIILKLVPVTAQDDPCTQQAVAASYAAAVEAGIDIGQWYERIYANSTCLENIKEFAHTLASAYVPAASATTEPIVSVTNTPVPAVTETMTIHVMQVLSGQEAENDPVFQSSFPNARPAQQGWGTFFFKLVLELHDENQWVPRNIQTKFYDSGGFERQTYLAWGETGAYLPQQLFLLAGAQYIIVGYTQIPNNQQPGTLEITIGGSQNPRTWRLNMNQVPVESELGDPPVSALPEAGSEYIVQLSDARITFYLDQIYFRQVYSNCDDGRVTPRSTPTVSSVVIPARLENTGGYNVTVNSYNGSLGFSSVDSQPPLVAYGVDSLGNYLYSEFRARWETQNPEGFISPEWEKGYLAPGESADFEAGLVWFAYPQMSDFDWAWIALWGLNAQGGYGSAVSLLMQSQEPQEFVCSSYWGPRDATPPPISITLDQASANEIITTANAAQLIELNSWQVENHVLALSPDLQTVAYYGERGIALWDLSTNSSKGELTPLDYMQSPEFAAFNRDGTLLVSVAYDDVRLWDVQTLSEVGRVSVRVVNRRIRFTQDSALVAFERGGILQVWDLRAGNQITQFDMDSRAESIDMSVDGSLLASGHSSGNISIWDIETGTVRFTRNQVDWIHRVTFNAVGSVLAVADAAGKIVLWDTANGTRLGTFSNIDDAGYLRGANFSPDGSILAYGYEDQIGLWDTRSMQLITVLETTGTWLVFHPTAPILADTAFDLQGNFVLQLWDVSSGNNLVSLLLDHSPSFGNARAIRFNAQGNLLMAAVGSVIKMWGIQPSS